MGKAERGRWPCVQVYEVTGMAKRQTGKPRVYSENVTAISNAVLRLRRALDLTQRQFAERVGVSVPTVARWETLDAPSGDGLKRLYGVAIEAEREGIDYDRRILYSALVQEEPIFRRDLVVFVKRHLSDALSLAMDGNKPAEDRVVEMGNAVAEAYRLVELFDPDRINRAELALRLAEERAGNVGRQKKGGRE